MEGGRGRKGWMGREEGMQGEGGGEEGMEGRHVEVPNMVKCLVGGSERVSERASS